MSLPVWRRALLLAALLAGLAATPSAAQDAAQETAPCAKLAAGEVRFPAGDAKRVVFVTATAASQNTVLITGCLRNPDGYSQEWQATGFIGENGFAPEGSLREGQYQSPTGSFSATEALGLANPGTMLTYHVVNPRSRWGGPGSPSYNSYLEGGSSTDENLWYWANQGTYAQATVINHNRPPNSPAVPGADYAIFFGAGFPRVASPQPWSSPRTSYRRSPPGIGSSWAWSVTSSSPPRPARLPLPRLRRLPRRPRLRRLDRKFVPPHHRPRPRAPRHQARGLRTSFPWERCCLPPVAQRCSSSSC